jgi:hypothetical protein
MGGMFTIGMGGLFKHTREYAIYWHGGLFTIGGNIYHKPPQYCFTHRSGISKNKPAILYLFDGLCSLCQLW